MDEQQLPPLDHPREVEYRRVRTEAIQVGGRIPEDVKVAIRDWHERNDFECAAHNEGQYCCLDYLLGDTAERWWTTPSR